MGAVALAACADVCSTVRSTVAAMFKIIAAPTFTCDVRLSRPDADEAVLISCTWRHKGTRELQQWLAGGADAADEAAFLDQVLADWSRVVDADGRPVPYGREALAALLATFPSAGRELVQAYYRRLTDARAKN